MENLSILIQSLPGLVHLQGTDFTEIEKAEKTLGLKFASDYKNVISLYGAISANGIELTGISSSPRLSVVEATEKARRRDSLPAGFYVIENLSIEKTMVVQNSSGNVFQFDPDTGFIPICKNLEEYIRKVI